MNDLVPAPWNVYETDPTDRKYMLVFNGYTRTTHRFPKAKVGSPFGSKADEKWTRFLSAEK
ncbi:MAG: hypothetical protein HQK87_05800, partial [Nitrospinae bacterium]|nr:hypothetical protein [Nitrospinota bacterium]